MRIFTFKNFRILALVIVLCAVALYSKDQRLVTQGWYKPLDIVVFPINADGSPAVDDYIEALSEKDLASIDKFIKRESDKFEDVVTSTPTITTLGSRVNTLPPKPPGVDANPIKIALWSLKLRWWTMQNTPDDKSNKHRIRIFVLYHETKDNKKLEHSLGLQKGLLGIVHAFASDDQTKQNNVVIAHELLHTVGATDKYDEYGNPIPLMDWPIQTVAQFTHNDVQRSWPVQWRNLQQYLKWQVALKNASSEIKPQWKLVGLNSYMLLFIP